VRKGEKVVQGECWKVGEDDQSHRARITGGGMTHKGVRRNHSGRMEMMSGAGGPQGSRGR